MVKKVICFIFAIPILLIALLGLSSSYDDGSATSPRAIFISLLVLGAVLLFMGIRAKTGKKKKEELETSIQNHDSGNKKQYKINHIGASHIAGLPLSENADCTIGFEADQFAFSGGGHDFNLKFNKISSVDIKTDVEIQKQYVSSVGGAVGGALLFGPLGAMVGGRAKARDAKTTSYYMIVTYLKEEEISYISFEITLADLVKATEFKKMFDEKYKTAVSTTVEL